MKWRVTIEDDDGNIVRLTDDGGVTSIEAWGKVDEPNWAIMHEALKTLKEAILE